MTRRMIAWTWAVLLTVLTGCQSLQRDAQVTQDQWEPDLETTASADN
jgi:hypothetical protein